MKQGNEMANTVHIILAATEVEIIQLVVLWAEDMIMKHDVNVIPNPLPSGKVCVDYT